MTAMHLKLVAGGVLAIVLAAGLGAYAYFFSGLRAAPQRLALASPTPAGSATATPDASTGVAGSWQVAAGSLARFRVQETVAGVGAHEAVAETSSVSGGFTLQPAGSDYQATGIRVTVGLAGLHSVDTLAGRDVTQRDGMVQRALSTGSYPDAVFEAGSVTIPAAAASGQTVSVVIPGRLTVHGQTRDVQAGAQVRVTGDTAQVVGSFTVDMTDFGVTPPRAPGISPASSTLLEFQANLKKA